MYSNILSLLSIVHYSSSQRCVPSERSPNNPITANCDLGFFDLYLDPRNKCICCTTTGLPDDNPPNECLKAPIPTPIKTAIGTLICNENFDCCSCNALNCDKCVALQCSGDSACIGVNPINIDGNCAIGGATLECNGDLSCFRSGIAGECVTAINCNGDNSCGDSIMELNLNKPIPDKIRPIIFIFNGDKSVPNSIIKAKNVAGFTCGGDGACYNTNIDIVCKTLGNDKGCKLEVGGDRAAPNSVWKVIGADFISCKGDNSCSGSKFDVECVIAGCPATFTGDNSAPNTIFNILNANELSCAGDKSCGNSKFNVICNNNKLGCPVTITGELAAQNALWNIKYSNQLKCVGVNACILSIFNLNCINNGCPISCSGSCKDAVFNVINSNGVICNGAIINFAGNVIGGSCENAIFKLDNNKNMKILCDGERSCENARFTNSLGGPVTNMASISCTAVKSCFGVKLVAQTLSNAFHLDCNSAQSCRNADINLKSTFTAIKSVNCNGPTSCDGLVLNLAGFNSNLFQLELLACNGATSCQDANINIMGLNNIEINNIVCGAMQSCLRSQLNINIGNNGIFISKITCGGINSCNNFNIIVTKGNVLVSKDLLDVKLFGCIIGTPSAANCNGATINGYPFTDFA